MQEHPKMSCSSLCHFTSCQIQHQYVTVLHLSITTSKCNKFTFDHKHTAFLLLTSFKCIRNQSLPSERFVRESVAEESVFVLSDYMRCVFFSPADLLPKSLAANSVGSRFPLIRSHSQEQRKSLWSYLRLWAQQRNNHTENVWLLCVSLYTHSLQLQDLLYMNRVNVRQYISIHPSHLWSSLCSAAPTE